MENDTNKGVDGERGRPSHLLLSTKFFMIMLAVPGLLVGTHYLKRQFPKDPELLTLIQIVSILLVLFGLYRTLVSAVLPAFSDRLGSDRLRSARYFLDFLFITTMVLSVMTLLGKGFSNLAIGGTLLSVILGIAGQNSLSNFFSGFILAIVQPFKVGDPISLVTWHYPRLPATYPHETVSPEHRGIVASIGMIYTSFDGEDGRRFMLPNAILLQSMILERKQSLVTLQLSIELPGDIPFPEIEKSIRTALEKAYSIPGSALIIRLTEIGSTTIVVSVRLPSGKHTESEVRDQILRGVLELKQPETPPSLPPAADS
ncbi:MAG: mechanosensitive ion channel family protein [Leptospirales bacterium]